MLSLVSCTKVYNCVCNVNGTLPNNAQATPTSGTTTTEITGYTKKEATNVCKAKESSALNNVDIECSLR
jgi:hypothetical protein